jgi:gliding motility-associated-like protein
MKDKFENILKQKISSQKITPSNRLNNVINDEIRRFSLKTKLIRTLKLTTTIISVSAIVLYFTLNNSNTTIQQPISNNSSNITQIEPKNKPKVHPTNQSSKQKTVKGQVTHTNKKSANHIAQIKKQKPDTILVKEEYTFNNNGLYWFSNEDNIIVSNSEGKTNLIFAKPGIYKIFAKDKTSNTKDSLVLLSLFAMPDHIKTCQQEYKLPEGLTTISNNKFIKKQSKNSITIPVYVSAFSHKMLDTITIEFLEKPQVEYRIKLTKEGKYNISFEVNKDVILYYNGKQISNLQNVSAGTYTVVAKNLHGCDTTITIKTEKTKFVDPNFEAQYLENRAGIPIYFKNKTSYYGYKNIDYVWNFGDGETSTKENPSHIYEKEGEYKVTLTTTADDGSTQTSSKTIIILPPKLTGQPNVFTPNGDGKNDIFRVQLPIKLQDFRCEIFSRSGKKIYEFTDPNSGWDGKIKGSPASQGIYYYIVTGTKEDGEPYIERSFIYLYR